MKSFLKQSKILLVLVMFFPAFAYADSLSQYLLNIANEFGVGAKALLYIIGVIGLVGFIWAFNKFKKAKEENRDTAPAMISMVVGLCLGIGTILYAAVAESVTDDTYEVKTEFNESDWN